MSERWSGEAERSMEEKWHILYNKLEYCNACINGSTDHSSEVAGGEQVSSVQREEDDGHPGEDEVVEGDVHSCLAAPVG